LSRCRTLVVGLLLAGATLAVTPAGAVARTFGSRPLKVGSHGSDVKVLQHLLTKVGVRTNADGQFGPVTRNHVRTWEGKSSLRVNGYVSRRDEATLRGQVAAGTSVLDLVPTGGTVAAPVAAGATATLGSGGLAVAPSSAPYAVQQVVAAANRIVGKPYKYGGGHGKWEDTGYDCSGSVSYALHGAGLLSTPLTSGGFESWGDPGQGTWITIYGSGGHAYMVVAGLRFDTGYHAGPSGPQWSSVMRPSSGYVAVHPAGL
jgi:peptidoglycan hydrolase-like protein with peptidoglycan-binding domain